MKKTLKIIRITVIILAVAIVVVFLFGSLFGGCVAKNYLNSHGQELIGRQIKVEHVAINLFSGHVGVHSLTLMEDNAVDQFAGLDTLDVAVSLLRLPGRTVHLRHLTLTGLSVNLVQDSGRMNFQSIIDHFAQDSTSADREPDPSPSPWVVSLHNIRLAGGRAQYTDLRHKTRSGLHDLNLFVPDFVVGGQGSTDAGLTVQLTKGGTLKANATWDAQTQGFTADLTLTGMLLDQLKDFGMNLDFVQRIDGELGLKAHVAGNLQQAMDMDISGKVEVDGLDLIDNTSASVASLNHLGVALNRLVLSQNLYDIGSIELDGLKLRYELFADSTNTFSRLFAKAKEVSSDGATEVEQQTAADSTAADPTLKPSPLQLHLGKLELCHMDFTYADHTLPDEFRFPVTDIRITAENISTAGTNRAKVFANLPGGGVLLANWEGNLPDWKQSQSLRLDVRNLHLESLSPYTVAYFGMPFAEGIFSFSSLNTIRNSQLSGENRVDIYKPSFGEHRKDVRAKLKLPVKAALYILKDKDDKVMLEVPIKGNVDSPEFDYMKLIWKTLGNLVVKVATSPARILSGLGNGSDRMFIAIDNQEPDFSGEQLYQIDRLAGVVKTDTAYRLQLQLHTRPTEDSTALRNQEIRNSILQKYLSDIGVPKEQFGIVCLQPSDTIKVEGYSVELSCPDIE